MGRWIPDGMGVQPGSDVGGDDQCTDAFDVRYHLADDDGVVQGRVHTDHGNPRHGPIGANSTETLYSAMTAYFYGVARFNDDGNLELDSDGMPVIWLQCQIWKEVCTDLDDIGGTERNDAGGPEYSDYDIFFRDFSAAEEYARKEAEKYANDPELFNRDFCWDGLAVWERS